jgi:hypothetical protein
MYFFITIKDTDYTQTEKTNNKQLNDQYPYRTISEIFLQEKAAEATNKENEEKRKKPKPPEEQEGMPQRQHCPAAKRR